MQRVFGRILIIVIYLLTQSSLDAEESILNSENITSLLVQPENEIITEQSSNLEENLSKNEIEMQDKIKKTVNEPDLHSLGDVVISEEAADAKVRVVTAANHAHKSSHSSVSIPLIGNKKTKNIFVPETYSPAGKEVQEESSSDFIVVKSILPVDSGSPAADDVTVKVVEREDPEKETENESFSSEIKQPVTHNSETADTTIETKSVDLTNKEPKDEDNIDDAENRNTEAKSVIESSAEKLSVTEPDIQQVPQEEVKKEVKDEDVVAKKEVDPPTSNNIEIIETTSSSEHSDEDKSPSSEGKATTPDAKDSKEEVGAAEEKTAVKLEVDDIQSFEEWKKKQIQNQEEAAATESIASPQRTIRTKKTQVNYASQDCGAKVLSHNPEAKHVSAILDENRDMYMLNPCSDHVWFVVELCEPIQIRQIQLANLELFSSSPRVFHLSISERYPAREWRTLGAFEARNERTVQTFAPTREESMFAKYLKFEMESHFGNEHFCPLTLVRALGVSMVEEYEEDEEKLRKETKKTDQVNGEERVVAESNQGEAREEGKNTTSVSNDKEDSSINKMYNIVKSAVNNLLGNGNQPVSNVSGSTNHPHSEVNKTQDEIDPTWESPVTLLTNKSEVEKLSAPLKRTPIVTLIETGDGQEVVFGSTPPPLYPITFLSTFTPSNFGTHICWFLEFIYRVSILSCVVQPHGNHSYTGVSQKYLKNTTLQPEDATHPVNTKKIAIGTKRSTVDETKKETEPHETKTKVEKIEIPEEENPEIRKADKNKSDESTLESDVGLEETGTMLPVAKETPSSNDDTTKETSSVVSDLTRVLQSGKDGEKCDVVADSTSSKDDEEDVVVEKREGEVKNEDHKTDEKSSGDEQSKVVIEEKQEVVKEEVTQKATFTEEKEEISENNPKSEEEPETSQNLNPKEDIPVTTSGPPTAIPPLKEEEASKMEQSLHDEDQVVINPGTNQKESILMRLSNRIRALEQNMSLSSAYLEDLSKRYKRQMDEMQRAFNLTQVRLSETSCASDENNLKQTEAIIATQNETATLKSQMDDMTESIEQMNRYMIARHLCLMAVEGFILTLICVTCFGVRQLRMVRRLEETEKQVQRLLELQKVAFSNSKENARVYKEKKSVKDNRSDLIAKLQLDSNQNHISVLDVPIISNGKDGSKMRSLSPSPSAAALKKPIKSPLSPLHKRKLKSNGGGKLRKNLKLNTNRSSQLNGMLTSELGTKMRQDQMKKSSSQREKSTSDLCIHPSAYSSANNRTLSTSIPGCRATNLFSWNTSRDLFTVLSGKAR